MTREKPVDGLTAEWLEELERKPTVHPRSGYVALRKGDLDALTAAVRERDALREEIAKGDAEWDEKVINPVKEHNRALYKENCELTAANVRLRETLDTCRMASIRGGIPNNSLHIIITDTLDSTPAANLAAIRQAERERCALYFQELWDNNQSVFGADYVATAIRNFKGEGDD